MVDSFRWITAEDGFRSTTIATSPTLKIVCRSNSQTKPNRWPCSRPHFSPKLQRFSPKNLRKVKIQEANGEGGGVKVRGRKEEREGDLKCNVMRGLEEVKRFSQRVQRKRSWRGKWERDREAEEELWQRMENQREMKRNRRKQEREGEIKWKGRKLVRRGGKIFP